MDAGGGPGLLGGRAGGAAPRWRPTGKAEAFFAGWTRKEAYIKARGEGIGLLGAVEVALAPGDAPRLIRVAGQPDEPERWSMEALRPAPGLCRRRLHRGRGRRWNRL